MALILCSAVNIDDGSAHVRKVVQTPKPTPLRVGDADRPKTLQGDCIFPVCVDPVLICTMSVSVCVQIALFLILVK